MSIRVGLLCNSPVAVPAIERLVASGHLVALGTSEMEHVANQRVHQLAENRDYPLVVVREASVEADLVGWVEAASLDAVFVVTFPYRIPQSAIDAPSLGTWNFHPSPLPRYRGADPIFWQLQAGEGAGASCAHRMTPGFDDGPVALEVPVTFSPDDTYGVATFRAAAAAGEGAVQLVGLLEEHGADIEVSVQDESRATRFANPTQDDISIHWAGSSSGEVRALVQACNPMHAGALAFFRGIPVRVYQVTAVSGAAPPPGQTVTDPRLGLVVGCREGAVRLDVVLTDDGVFSGERFARLFGVASGESFDDPERAPA